MYSYLKNRTQAVRINGFIGDFLSILSGVPQGSILGPILFNIFLNDLIYHMENTPTDDYNFSDDNTLSSHAENIGELIKKLHDGSEEALKWLENNKMLANPDKFQLIVLSKPSLRKTDESIEMNIRNENLNAKTSVKLLGIEIDDKLNFKKHIKDLCGKAGLKLNSIKRLARHQNESERKLLVNAHVISQFQYCTNVWHFCGLTEIHKMEKINERSLRFIYNEYEENYFTFLIKRKLTTLYGQRVRKMCCEIFRTIKNENPSYMNDILENRPSKYPSRKENDLFVPRANQITYGQKSFRIYGVKLWNHLPPEIKNIDNFDEFKRKLKEIETPFCECEKCLTSQIGTEGSTSSLAERLLHEKIFC